VSGGLPLRASKQGGGAKAEPKKGGDGEEEDEDLFDMLM
jgi:hypothetical protein